MGFLSAIKGVVSKVRSAVRDTVAFIATKGEAFIGTVKEVYAKVKPYLQKLSPFLQHAAKVAGAIHPLLGKVVFVVDKTLTALLALENSPILKKIEEAMRWVIERAKQLHVHMTAAEEEIARKHDETLRAAKASAQTAEQSAALAVAAMINQLALVQTGIANRLDDGAFTNYEHYLRLRATQRLIRSVNQAFEKANSIEDIAADDIFLVQLGVTLLSEQPEMSEQEAERLDGIVRARYGKQLVPFVFEEMHKMWQLALTDDTRLWKKNSATLAQARAIHSRLKFEMLVSPLSVEEQQQFDKLDAELPQQLADHADLMNRNVERENYISATEGFLQLLEKDEAELRAADQEYLLDLGAEVGALLMECAQKNLRWTQLSEEQQALVADFANIFRNDSIKRGQALELECHG